MLEGEKQGEPGDLRLTVYDRNSVMNYCAEPWLNEGQLSDLDKEGLQLAYGAPPG